MIDADTKGVCAEPGVLELKLLGEIEIYRDGARVEPLPPRKTVALLAYLVTTGRRHRRDRLCSIFWEIPDDPRAALRWSLTKLRHVVDEPDEKRIVADREGVAFDPGQAGVDLFDVQTAIARGLEGTPTDELKRLAGLFRGTFIEGTDLPNCHEFQTWCTAERDEVQAARTRILSELVARLKDDPQMALPHARALVDISGDREQADELVNRLRARSVEQLLPLPEKPSIAVLPFQNMSDDIGQDYFADGMTEDIITELSKFRQFFVIARNSTFTYKDRPIDVKRVGRELGVRYVVEGSARKAGNRFRITAQLIDATTGNHVWADKYDRELKDIFALQDEITESIATSIGPEFLSAEMNRARRKNAQNLDARERFMRGFWHYARFTKMDNAEAQRLARAAIELDPDAAEPHALLAFVLQIDFMYGWCDSPDQTIREAHKEALQAVTFDDHDAMAFRCLGIMDLYLRRYADSIRHLEKAIELNSNDADGFALLGGARGYMGDYDGAREYIDKAIRLSPRDTFLISWYNFLAHAASAVGRDEEAVEWGRQMIQERSTHPAGYRVLASSFSQLGRQDEARAAMNTLRELLPDLTIADVRDRVPFKDAGVMERYLDGLRNAGLPE